jgi:hypothetical protein
MAICNPRDENAFFFEYSESIPDRTPLIIETRLRREIVRWSIFPSSLTFAPLREIFLFPFADKHRRPARRSWSETDRRALSR